MAKKKKPERREPPSLHPIPFEEAVTDLLKVKPAPKGKRAKVREKPLTRKRAKKR